MKGNIFGRTDIGRSLGTWDSSLARPTIADLGEEPPAKPAEETPPAATAPAAEAAPAEAPAAAAPAGEAKGAAPAGEGASESPPASKSFLRFVFDASPVLFIIIVGMSIYLISTIISGFMALRVKNVIPPPIIEQLNERLKEKQFREAFELLRNDTSLFSRSLRGDRAAFQ